MKINEVFGSRSSNAQKYVKPMFKKWEDTLKTYGAAGVDIRNPEKQKQILAGIIGDYARLTKSQIKQLHDAIQSADLNNSNQVKAIMNQAVSNTLANRGVPLYMLEPEKEPEEEPEDSSSAPEPPTSRLNSGDTAMAGGVEYVWNGSEWRRGDTGEVAPARLAAVLAANRK